MNVLLVTIDSLRADRVRSENGLTPRLDALAGEAVDFRQTVTHGHGTPVAFPAILTGTYPMLYGGCSRLSPDRPVLARRLRELGHDTVAFTSNPHLFEKYGYRLGFEEFNEYRADDGGGENHSLLERIRLTVQPYLDHGSRVYDLLRRVYYFLLTTTDERPYAPADEINDHFLEWLDDRDGEDPFFSWVHYMDVHYPFYQDDETLSAIGADPIPKSRQRRVNRLMNEDPGELTDEEVETLSTLYDAETYFADRELGRLIDGLRDRDLYEDTLVIVTSDHGEALGEHDGFGHYKALYEEIVRVPLVVRVPGEGSATVESQVGLVDLAPTVLDYLGADLDDRFSGESLRPLVEGAGPDGIRERQVLGHGDPLGVRTDRWKYIWWDRDDDEPTDAELFDLHADPGETTDVADDHPEVVASFDRYLADHVHRAGETDRDLDAGADEETDEEIAAQLEALGYK